MFEIDYYDLPNGEMPVEKFINSLDNKMRAKVFGRIELLKEYGNSLREPYSKYVREGLFELRIEFAGDITRIFYFFITGSMIILTNGFIKKNDKTPKKEIDLAKKYKDEYEKRSRNE